MQPRVYVAAPFSEWKLVRQVQAEIQSRGGVTSHDWTAGIEALPPGVTDGDVSEEVALDAALADIEGVLTADACIFLTVGDKTKGRGMFVEMGAAIVRRLWSSPIARTQREMIQDQSLTPRIAVCGPHRDSTIFSRLGKRFADWKDALPYVLGSATP